MQLLAVSSDRDMLQIFEAYFSLVQIDCIVANSHTNCLDIIKSSDEKFEIIILDIDLYNKVGLSLAREILALNPNQLIIITTANSSKDLWREVEMLGIKHQNILLKPFDLAKLSSTVRQAVLRTAKVGLKDHIIAFYNSLADELIEAIQFIKIGIENNECVLFLANNNLTLESVRDRFVSNEIDLNKLMSDHSLIFIDSEKWYLSGGKVNRERIKKQWLELVDKSLSVGKKGLRAFCMMDTFFDHDLIDEIVDYESEYPPKFDFNLLSVCAYSQKNIDKLPLKQKERLTASHGHVWIAQAAV